MKSKRYFLLILLLLLVIDGKANNPAPGWQWAKSMGGNTEDAGNCTATDALGNVYTVGYFTGTVDFNPGLDTFLLTAASSQDIFISKINNAGNFVWAKAMGGIAADVGYSIAIDDSGNIYTTGTFMGIADFDPGTGIFNLINSAGSGSYISKLDSAGNFIWAKPITGFSSDNTCLSITLDATGNIFTTGYFSGTTDFDPGTGIYNLTSSGSFDIFVQKLDNQGNFAWAKAVDGNADKGGYSIITDVSGNVYITGLFQGTADFDPGPPILNLTSVGWTDIFILKLDGLGNFAWAKTIGGTGFDIGNSIAIDLSGNGDVFITGLFEETADFDPGPGTYNLSSPGNQDAFILKLDSSGNFIWAKTLSGLSSSVGSFSIAIDAPGNIYTTGFFTSVTDFDPDAGVFNLTPVGVGIFILKLNGSGNFVWAKAIGGATYQFSTGLSLYGNDNIHLTGYFESPFLSFGSDSLANSDLSGNSKDIFIAKISCSSFATLNPITCNSYTSPSGNFTWTTSGTYTDTIPNATTCDSIITINLTINTVDTLVLQNGVTLTANVTGGSYQWLDCNNGFAAINGDTSQSFIASANGNYAVSITQSGCTDTSACYTVTGVGINEISNEGNFEIFPNPAGSYCTLTFKNNMGSVIVNVRDITGNAIYKTETKSQKIKINTTDFAEGIYFVQIQMTDFVETKKLIITR